MCKLIRTLLLAQCLVSSAALAETADIASSKRLAGELQICNAYFLSVSQCFAEEPLAKRLGPQAAQLTRLYAEQADKAQKIAWKIAQATGMSAEELSAILMTTLKGMANDIAGRCVNVETLISKWGPACKQLVENPLMRLKQLSECPHEKKMGC